MAMRSVKGYDSFQNFRVLCLSWNRLKEKAWTEELPPLPTNGILDPLLIDPLGRTRLKKLKTRPWTPGEKKPQVGDGNQENSHLHCVKNFCRSKMFENFVGQFLGSRIRGLKLFFFFSRGWLCWVEGVPFIF